MSLLVDSAPSGDSAIAPPLIEPNPASQYNGHDAAGSDIPVEKIDQDLEKSFPAAKNMIHPPSATMKATSKRKLDHDIPELTPSTAEVLARVNARAPESDLSRESSAPMSMSPSASPPQTANGASSSTSTNPFDRPRYDRTALTNAFAHVLGSRTRTSTPQQTQSPQKSSYTPQATASAKQLSPPKDSVDEVPNPPKRLKLSEPAPPVVEDEISQMEDQKDSEAQDLELAADIDSTIQALPSNGPAAGAPFRTHGKGLGRGRPGIKRGPRKPKPESSGIDQPTTPLLTPTPQSLTSTPLRSSGKGLGRGRPGVKRGPRQSTIRKQKMQEYKRLEVLKRKREESDGEPTKANKASDGESSASEGDQYTPQATLTKSGRQVNRPSAFVPPESPASSTKKPREEEPRHFIKKGNVAKGGEQLCEKCDRPQSPAKNPIVFCDKCNRCWHQRCHEPRIPDLVITDKDAEWLCKDCSDPNSRITVSVKIKAGRGQKLRTRTSQPNNDSPAKVESTPNSTPAPTPSTKPAAAVAAVPASPIVQSDFPPLTDRNSYCAHPEWKQSQRREYFSKVPQAHLIDLLLHAARVNPMLALYRTGTPAAIATPTNVSTPGITTSSANQRSSQTRVLNTTSAISPSAVSHSEPPISTSVSRRPSTPSQKPLPNLTSAAEEEQEEEEDDTDELKALYPKPGDGIQLPPESEDMAMLLEGQEMQTFSHRLWGGRSDGGMVGA
ncbi:MAG: hypothetical protein Q9227_001798 [Pyrenula ochraceoflavens]